MSRRRMVILISLLPIFHTVKITEERLSSINGKEKRNYERSFHSVPRRKRTAKTTKRMGTSGCTEYSRRLLFVAEVMVAGISRNKRRTMYNNVFSSMAVALNGTYDSNEENNVA
jgi:hypothetical protein